LLQSKWAAVEETYRRVGIWACGRLKRVINFVKPDGHYSHVDRQSYFQYADTPIRRYADTLPPPPPASGSLRGGRNPSPCFLCGEPAGTNTGDPQNGGNELTRVLKGLQGRLYTIDIWLCECRLWILLKNPLVRKILNSWGIKSPCLYRKNPSTGILERRFLSPEYDFLQCRKSGGFRSRIDC
jgi:hypothetical protein